MVSSSMVFTNPFPGLKIEERSCDELEDDDEPGSYLRIKLTLALGARWMTAYMELDPGASTLAVLFVHCAVCAEKTNSVTLKAFSLANRCPICAHEGAMGTVAGLTDSSAPARWNRDPMARAFEVILGENGFDSLAACLAAEAYDAAVLQYFTATETLFSEHGSSFEAFTAAWLEGVAMETLPVCPWQ